MSWNTFKCFVLNSLCSKAKQLRIVLCYRIRSNFYEIHLLWKSTFLKSASFIFEWPTNPGCCKKQQRKFMSSYWFAEWGTSEGPEWFQTDCIWVQVIPLIIQNQFHTIQNLQRSPIPQTSNWSETFWAVSYSKPALISRILKFGQQRKKVFLVWTNTTRKVVF